jgi:hypothetical protein
MVAFSRQFVAGKSLLLGCFRSGSAIYTEACWCQDQLGISGSKGSPVRTDTDQSSPDNAASSPCWGVFYLLVNRAVSTQVGVLVGDECKIDTSLVEAARRRLRLVMDPCGSPSDFVRCPLRFSRLSRLSRRSSFPMAVPLPAFYDLSDVLLAQRLPNMVLLPYACCLLVLGVSASDAFRVHLHCAKVPVTSEVLLQTR